MSSLYWENVKHLIGKRLFIATLLMRKSLLGMVDGGLLDD